MTLEQIKKLKKFTNLPTIKCKHALELHSGSFENAVKYLEELGLCYAEKLIAENTKSSKEGIICVKTNE